MEEISYALQMNDCNEEGRTYMNDEEWIICGRVDPAHVALDTAMNMRVLFEKISSCTRKIGLIT